MPQKPGGMQEAEEVPVKNIHLIVALIIIREIGPLPAPPLNVVFVIAAKLAINAIRDLVIAKTYIHTLTVLLSSLAFLIVSYVPLDDSDGNAIITSEFSTINVLRCKGAFLP